MTVRGFSAAGGGCSVSGGAAVGGAVGGALGVLVGAALGGVTVVTVSGGSLDGLGDVLGGAVGLGIEGVEIIVRGVGAPTVALVDALSPLLTMTAVAIAPSATTAPTIAATGRHRLSAGQANSP